MTDANTVGLNAKHIFVSGWSRVRIRAPKGVSSRLKASCTPIVSPDGDPTTRVRLLIKPDRKGNHDLELFLAKGQAVLVRDAEDVDVSPDVKASVIVEVRPGQKVTGLEDAAKPAQTESAPTGT